MRFHMRFPLEQMSLLTRLANSLVLVFALWFLFLLNGCPREPKLEELGSQNESVANEDFIRVGAALPLSGPIQGFGVMLKNGIDLAVGEINSAGGVYKKKFRVIYEDTEGKAPFAESLTRKLVTLEEADFLIASASSTEAIQMARVAQELKVPLLVPVATNPQVTLNEDGSTKRYVFRVCFTDNLQGRAMATFTAKDLGAKSVAILWDSSSAYSRHLREIVLSSFRSNFKDVQVMTDEAYIGGGIVTSFKPIIDRIALKKFEVLLLPGYYTDAVEIIGELRSKLPDVKIVGGDGLGSYEFLRQGGSSVEGVYLTNHFSSDMPDEKSKSFVESFHKQNETLPDAFAALAYDTVYLLADAIKRARTLDSEEVTNALEKTVNFQGVTGKISIDSQHNAIKDIVVETVRSMRFEFVRKISPEEILGE